MEISQVLSLVTNLLLIVLIVVAFTGKSKIHLKLLFAGFNISLLFWSLSLDLYYSVTAQPELLYVGRFNFVAIAFTLTILYFFLKSFPIKYSKYGNINDIIVVLMSPILIVTMFSNVIIEGELALSKNVRETVFGSLYYIYVGYIVILIALSTLNLVSNYKQSSIYYRTQMQYLMFGFVGTIALALITNLVLPLLGFFDLQQMGPFSTIIFSSSIVLSMVRNKFLSSNIIIGRSLEMITMSALTYLLFHIVLFIDNAFFGGIYTPSAMIIGIPIAIIFTIITNNIKGILNKYVYENIVNKDFNPLTELNLLTQELSKEVQLDIIFEKIFNNIQRNLNTKKTMFILSGELFPDTQNVFPINEKTSVTHNEILHLFHTTAQTKLLVLPELSDEFYNNTNPTNQKIIEKLREEKIELIFKVINDKKIIGFLLLGRKEDSNQFYYSNEVGYLKSLIDLLNSTIEKSKLYNEINAFNINLQKKIKDATANLSKVNKQLKILDSAKSDFISIASHQLRTPLSIIKGYISMLTEGDYGKVNTEQVKVMTMTFSAVGDLEEVVNELLTSSRIERGKFTITKTPNDIIELINYVQRLYSDKYKQKGLYLKINYPKGLKKLIIDFDKEKFHQVIVNLIENAFNYTPKGGVTVSLDNKQSNILLSVKDTGIGIPEEGKKKLFERFSRLSNAQNLRPDGTGIGLFTAKIITEKHDGKIWFESEINKGTTFFVEIPKK